MNSGACVYLAFEEKSERPEITDGQYRNQIIDTQEKSPIPEKKRVKQPEISLSSNKSSEQLWVSCVCCIVRDGDVN